MCFLTLPRFPRAKTTVFKMISCIYESKIMQSFFQEYFVQRLHSLVTGFIVKMPLKVQLLSDFLPQILFILPKTQYYCKFKVVFISLQTHRSRSCVTMVMKLRGSFKHTN